MNIEMLLLLEISFLKVTPTLLPPTNLLITSDFACFKVNSKLTMEECIYSHSQTYLDLIHSPHQSKLICYSLGNLLYIQILTYPLLNTNHKKRDTLLV